MSDPGYRTDVDWSAYQVCGYCHAIVRRDEYIRHDIERHDGLARTRDDHELLCLNPMRRTEGCMCRIEEYEVVAAVMAAEKMIQGEN